ncbi:unnamed protein product [Orchesella dallaii]|uniref:Cullin family profile domain-containing protein n=1 Tax=Orchesella dallaii TaxID=48710 RepID=A0ABP1S1N3_9HEXA
MASVTDGSLAGSDQKWSYLQLKILALLCGEEMTAATMEKMYRHLGQLNSINPGRFYIHWKLCVQHYLQGIRKEGNLILKDGQVIIFYTTQWQKFNANCSHVLRILDDMNRMLRYHGRPRRTFLDMDKIRLIAVAIWKELVVETCHEQWFGYIRRSIRRRRIGKTINTSLVVAAIGLYKECGVDVYLTFFEKKFLHDSFQFYLTESLVRYENFTKFRIDTTKLLINDLKMAEKELGLPQRPTLYWLRKACEKALIQKNWVDIFNEIKNLLSEEKLDEIKTIYTYLARVSEFRNIDEIRFYFFNYWKVPFQESKSDLKLRDFGALLNMHRKRSKFVVGVYQDEQYRKTELDKECLKFLSKNSTQPISELLARYCDSLITKSLPDIKDDEVPDVLDKVMELYSCLTHGQDEFRSLYHKLLAERLVCQTSASNQNEILMVEKMHNYVFCEILYLANLEILLKDVQVSKDLNGRSKFRRQQPNGELSVDFNIQIFSADSWPLARTASKFYPPELNVYVNKFEEFYKLKCPGKTLQWLDTYSNCELASNCFRKRHVFRVSMAQTKVLLMFNSNDSYSIQELIEMTKLEMECFRRALRSLVRTKVLILTKDNNRKQTDGFMTTDVVALNKQYGSS